MNRQRLKKIFITLGLGAILVYGYYEFRGLLYGPELIIGTPQNGVVTAEQVAIISGSTRRISKITLNGRNIFIDENGLFSEHLSLLPGVNFVTMSVSDRFGNSVTKSLEVVYDALPTLPSTEPVVDETASTSPDTTI